MAELRDRQIRLVHELMYQIKVKEVMTTDVVCFTPQTTFRTIQLCMKERRFSGTPIVDADALCGMISIDDIITAFDRGWIDEPVADYMTRDVRTVPQDYSVIAASKAERVEAQEAVAGQAMAQTGDVLRFELAPDGFELAGTASTAVKKHLQKLGLLAALIRRVAVICYEAEMNVIIHSLGGYLEVRTASDSIQILVGDEGPGIPDIDEAMEPGFTTANEKIRALGFGAGMGLCNIKRCADHFEIRSSMETGTVVRAVVGIPAAGGVAARAEPAVVTAAAEGTETR